MEVEQRREAARKATAYLSLPTNAPIETVLDTLAADLRSENPIPLQRAMGVIASHNATAQAPVVPAETAPLYMAALNSFWLTVHSVYPNADRVTMPQAIAQAFEVAAAGVVEAWMSAYDAGGYSDVNFGG